MAKTPKLKNNKPKSIHSRAARRAASPSNELDKSLTSLPRAETAIPVPVTHTNAGVSKKKPKSKAKTRAQRLRQQKGIERAEVVMDQLEKKVAKSVGKGKKVKARKINWDDLNSKLSKTTENQQGTEGPDVNDSMVDDDQPMTSAAPEKALSVFTNVPAVNNDMVADEPEKLDEEDEIT
ncbi:hypothetical protein VTN77DRAFT_3849 [Rasamsonia byssochlamydoides]|uniref:uncharacterized protein n=1 Tax=Rasamsonia byssochlamydoides TaxID=89139 RepID=UPI003743FF4F